MPSDEMFGIKASIFTGYVLVRRSNIFLGISRVPQGTTPHHTGFHDTHGIADFVDKFEKVQRANLRKEGKTPILLRTSDVIHLMDLGVDYFGRNTTFGDFLSAVSLEGSHCCRRSGATKPRYMLTVGEISGQRGIPGRL